MIVSAIPRNSVFYRVITPQWAFAPESGAGAAISGARFNRPGIEALYLASSEGTALAEYRGESTLLQAGTVVSYHVEAERVAVFSGGYTSTEWAPIWQRTYCNWKKLAFLDGIDPPSWDIANLVVAAGCSGILYQSQKDSGGICLVLFRMAGAHRLLAYDPDGLLPRNNSSWV